MLPKEPPPFWMVVQFKKSTFISSPTIKNYFHTFLGYQYNFILWNYCKNTPYLADSRLRNWSEFDLWCKKIAFFYTNFTLRPNGNYWSYENNFLFLRKLTQFKSRKNVGQKRGAEKGAAIILWNTHIRRFLHFLGKITHYVKKSCHAPPPFPPPFFKRTISIHKVSLKPKNQS